MASKGVTTIPKGVTVGGIDPGEFINNLGGAFPTKGGRFGMGRTHSANEDITAALEPGQSADEFSGLKP